MNTNINTPSELVAACLELVGTHDAANEERCHALAAILNADASELCYEARCVRDALEDAFYQTRETGSNELATEEWAYVQAYVDDSLAGAYTKVREMSFTEQSDYLNI